MSQQVSIFQQPVIFLRTLENNETSPIYSIFDSFDSTNKSHTYPRVLLLSDIYQTVWSYCLSRDCPTTCTCRLKFRLQKPSKRRTSQQKSPLRNNISPYLILNTALKSRNRFLVTGYRLLKKLPKPKISSHSLTHSLTTVASLEPKRSSE